MISVRRSAERGSANFRWLDAKHTFSFGEYFDRKHMNFEALRVINEDRIAPEGGFPSHPHRDMEIITYIVEGSLEHKDSMGNGSVLRRGQIQRMSAGSGVQHSEFNPSKTEPTHLLQIWIRPERPGLEPSYEDADVAIDQRPGELVLIGSANPKNGAVKIHQDVELYAASLFAGDEVQHELAEGRSAWVQVISGSLLVNDAPLNAGDGASIVKERDVSIVADDAAEFLLFDLAKFKKKRA